MSILPVRKISLPYKGVRMITENCKIDAFVETVKNKTSWEALSLAVEEATRADRMGYQPPAVFEKCNR